MKKLHVAGERDDLEARKKDFLKEMGFVKQVIDKLGVSALKDREKKLSKIVKDVRDRRVDKSTLESYDALIDLIDMTSKDLLKGVDKLKEVRGDVHSIKTVEDNFKTMDKLKGKK